MLSLIFLRLRVSCVGLSGAAALVHTGKTVDDLARSFSRPTLIPYLSLSSRTHSVDLQQQKNKLPIFFEFYSLFYIRYTRLFHIKFFFLFYFIFLIQLVIRGGSPPQQDQVRLINYFYPQKDSRHATWPLYSKKRFLNNSTALFYNVQNEKKKK